MEFTFDQRQFSAIIVISIITLAHSSTPPAVKDCYNDNYFEQTTPCLKNVQSLACLYL